MASAADGKVDVDGGAEVTLVSAEGEKFVVPKRVAQLSELVKTMTDEGSGEEVPLMDVKSGALSKIIEFCKHHVDHKLPEIEKPLRSANLAEVVPEWDAKFVVDMEQELLFEMILAANYMDIKSLLDLCCAKVASMIKGKTTEEIRKTFNIKNDFTPEEEAQVREENRWCEDA